MLGLTQLHAIAASRGDGLRPELLTHFTQQQQLVASNVEDIESYRSDHHVKAGPHPRGEAGRSASNVVAFQRSLPANTIERSASVRTK